MQKQRVITTFQQKVYAATKTIPKGRVTTYKMLAEVLQCRSSQAIGQALRKNPFAPDVPCHRVIKTDLSIGGFYGAKDGETVSRKLDLLKSEGVEFINNRLREKERLFSPHSGERSKLCQ